MLFIFKYNDPKKIIIEYNKIKLSQVYTHKEF